MCLRESLHLAHQLVCEAHHELLLVSVGSSCNLSSGNASMTFCFVILYLEVSFLSLIRSITSASSGWRPSISWSQRFSFFSCWMRGLVLFEQPKYTTPFTFLAINLSISLCSVYMYWCSTPLGLSVEVYGVLPDGKQKRMEFAKLQRSSLVRAGDLYSCKTWIFSAFVLAFDTLWKTSDIRVLFTGSLAFAGLGIMIRWTLQWDLEFCCRWSTWS